MTKDEYLKNVEILNKWADSYYRLDNPIASDEEYDNLYNLIKEYETKNPKDVAINSPTQRVGGKVLEEFNKAFHLTKMWSLEKISNINEINNWIKKVSTYGDLEFYCEPKYDGASLNLIYENGYLVKAITRGDGEIGEDVTINARTIKTIPFAIDYKELIEIRGEVVIYKDDFDRINSERLKDNLPLFANPRNASAGSLRQLDSKICAKRKLVFIPWGFGKHNLKSRKFSDIMKFIYSLGFIKPNFREICKNIEEIEKFYQKILKNRNSEKILLDGMVVKINSLGVEEKLGYTKDSPRWAFAYKFPAIEKTTKLLDVVMQIGRTGVITPVGILEKILIDGVYVERVTLHNFEEIKNKDLKIGDIVTIIRSGDVIPKLITVLKDRRTGLEKEIIKPTHCPNCGSLLLDEGVLIKCQNLSCSAIAINSIIHFAKKSCMNIDGLGESIVTTLFEANLIKDILDLYNLCREDLLKLEGFKDRKVDNLLNAIENSKNVECSKFLNSLGILHIGEVASKKICDKFGLDFLNLTYNDLIQIDGFGIEIVNSFLDFIRINNEKILKLMEIVKPKNSEKEKINSIFKNKKIVLTGSMSKTRDEIKTILENLGATVSNNISKTTDYLIYGENSGSKLDKAEVFGVKVLSEDEFWKSLD